MTVVAIALGPITATVPDLASGNALLLFFNNTIPRNAAVRANC